MLVALLIDGGVAGLEMRTYGWQAGLGGLLALAWLPVCVSVFLFEAADRWKRAENV